MEFNERIFREYDIRGTVGSDFDEEFAEVLGVAYASLVREQFPDAAKLSFAVGYDCRVSSPGLSSALMNGLSQGGLEVIDSGMGPSPQLYFVAVSQSLSGGIQVTGSHNPGHQNGFKMMIGAKTLSGDDIVALRERVLQVHASPDSFIAETPGERFSFDARSAYIDELVARSTPEMGKRKLKIVVDAGNGVGGLVGPDILRGLGCEVVELYTEPDGNFPNHHPDPTVVENLADLRERVIAEKADLGIAWDGDADRIGVVDEQANVIFGDMLLTIYGRRLLSEVDNPIIVGDVKCSDLMFDDLKCKGAETVMCRTGHSLIKAKLKELKAHLAGEMSGHMFFAHRYYGFDDAIHASARLAEIISNTEQPMSSLLSDLPSVVSTPEIRLDCPEEIKFEVAKRAQEAFPEFEANTLDGVRVRFEKGWGLVRASNTQPVLVLRFEADSEERLNEYQTLVEKRVNQIIQELA